MFRAFCFILTGIATTAQGALPLHREIDRVINAQAGGPSATTSSDAEFFRRVQLDIAGTIPDAGQVRDFLNDKSTQKRAQLIDSLLASESFAVHWTDRLSTMLLERQALGKVTDGQWRAYLKRSMQGTPRWDVMAREMLTAAGKGESRAAMKFLGNGSHHRLTEDVARLFLGMDLKCAKCHDHPSVKEWKQAHYWGLYAYLNQTKQATNSKDKQVYFVESLATGKIKFQSVFEDNEEETGPRLPGGIEVSIPAYEKGKEFDKPATDGLPAVPRFRPRELLARDLPSKENVHFVHNAVNRVWFLMMGRGLVHPLDEMHGKNPSSHPKLTAILAREFVAHQFDLKWLLREIALSESYQRSSLLPEGVKTVAASSYRTAHPKAMTPEQLLNAILKATGNLEKVTAMKTAPDAEKFDRRGYFSGTHGEMPKSFEEIRAIFMETFAQPAGEAEDDFLPGLNRSLFLMNDRLVLHWLEPHDDNLVQRLAKMQDHGKIADEMYLSVLARFPEGEELPTLTDYLEKNETRRDAALGELAWALLTSTEFRLNH
ncbi:MAG: DUF1549 domain-containing protein [Verrucomicrobiales bacterium]